LEEFLVIGKKKKKKEKRKSTLMEEVRWRQKSRPLWLREGDKYTYFFHEMAYSNRRKNSIDTLLIDGTISTNRLEISEYIVQFYKKLYIE